MDQEEVMTRSEVTKFELSEPLTSMLPLTEALTVMLDSSHNLV